jgi:hypothetical protein
MRPCSRQQIVLGREGENVTALHRLAVRGAIDLAAIFDKAQVPKYNSFLHCSLQDINLLQTVVVKNTQKYVQYANWTAALEGYVPQFLSPWCSPHTSRRALDNSSTLL